MSNQEEKIETFIKQYYEKDHYIPREILLPQMINSKTILEGILKERKGTKVIFLHPKRGPKAKLLQMAVVNAEKELKEKQAAKDSKTELLNRLQQKLQMKSLPKRIECFDNSNIAGESPVAAMVVFYNGMPEKSSYRKYNIKTVSGPDDYASMYEVLKRRFQKKKNPKDDLPMPDLLVVDGGKGQLGIAMAVLQQLHLPDTPHIIGIAKKNPVKGETQDKIFLPGRGNPINLSRDEDLLLFLQQVRDEAHRFAISFHRKKRAKSMVTSKLDNIPGIGPKRKKALLRHFKSIKRIQAADISEIIALPGMDEKSAKRLLDYLDRS